MKSGDKNHLLHKTAANQLDKPDSSNELHKIDWISFFWSEYLLSNIL